VKVAKFNLAVFKAGHPQKGIWKQSQLLIFPQLLYLLWLGVTDVCHLKNWRGGCASWCVAAAFSDE
jgi:hypothetical protein